MTEIKLVKRYPHIKDEDVTSIFQEGYIKGYENGRRGAIPIEWINKKSLEFLTNKNFRLATDFQEVIDMWKVENNIPLFDGELKITCEKEKE